jgi:hypothetical protein
MSFIANVPALRLGVLGRYLGVKTLGVGTVTLEMCYLVAVTAEPSGPLWFTVHLESGALWQRLPIEALRATSNLYPVVIAWAADAHKTDELQPYSCLEGDIAVIEYKHLRNYDVIASVGGAEYKGSYLFTVDVLGSGLANDPVQHKTHNIVVLENGQLAALPNNRVRFIDKYFTDSVQPRYSRVDRKYSAGG